MTYLRRFGLASFSSFVVLLSYTLALKISSQINADILLAITMGALACCLVAGGIAAAIFRRNMIVLVISSQILSIALIGIVWCL